MSEATKIFLSLFFAQMFVIYAIKVLPNPWMQVIASLIIAVIASVIYLVRLKRKQ